MAFGGRKCYNTYIISKLIAKQHNGLIKVVTGARQIGKTESIRKFAKENYTTFIEINFIEEPKYKVIISEGYSASEISL